MFYLFAIFIAVPFIELILLLSLADRIGAPSTLAVIVFTGILGASLARWQGWKTYQRIHTELTNQRMPTESMADAGMILVAGALLLTPGILTDVFGFSLLIPICRRFYRTIIIKSFRGKFRVQTTVYGGTARHRDAADTNVVDGHVVDGHVVSPDQTRSAATQTGKLR